jgi:thiamine transporter ThiT
MIETPQVSRRFSYRELGLADNRTLGKIPGLLWGLLKLFANNHKTVVLHKYQIILGRINAFR